MAPNRDLVWSGLVWCGFVWYHLASLGLLLAAVERTVYMRPYIHTYVHTYWKYTYLRTGCKWRKREGKGEEGRGCCTKHFTSTLFTARKYFTVLLYLLARVVGGVAGCGGCGVGSCMTSERP